MVALELVDHSNERDISFLYTLLEQRPSEANISHQRMPGWSQHFAFVSMRPYQAWYFIIHNQERIGAIYLTDRSEIGIDLMPHCRSEILAREAITALAKAHPRDRYFANVAPGNAMWHSLFQGLQGQVIQHTYAFTQPPSDLLAEPMNLYSAGSLE